MISNEFLIPRKTIKKDKKLNSCLKLPLAPHNTTQYLT